MSKLRFDDAAAEWDEKPLRVVLAEHIAAGVQARVPLSPKMRMLDYGCGTGLVSLQLLPHVQEGVGMDFSDGMLEALNGKLTAQGIENYRTQTHDMTKEPLPEAAFDLIVSGMTMHHIPDYAGFVAACTGALRPGGWLCIGDLEDEDGTFHERGNDGVAHFGFAPEAVRAEFTTGLVDVSIDRVHTVERGERRYPIFLACGRRAP